MAEETESDTIKKSAEIGILRTGSNVYICPVRIQCDSRNIDNFSLLGISSIIAAEFAKHAVRVEHGTDCSDLRAETSEAENIPDNGFDYVIKPLIRKWSSNESSSVNRRMKICLDIEIYNVEEKRRLGSFVIENEAPWQKGSPNYHWELITEPLEKTVPRLFS